MLKINNIILEMKYIDYIFFRKSYLISCKDKKGRIREVSRELLRIIFLLIGLVVTIIASLIYISYFLLIGLTVGISMVYLINLFKDVDKMLWTSVISLVVATIGMFASILNQLTEKKKIEYIEKRAEYIRVIDFLRGQIRKFEDKKEMDQIDNIGNFCMCSSNRVLYLFKKIYSDSFFIKADIDIIRISLDTAFLIDYMRSEVQLGRGNSLFFQSFHSTDMLYLLGSFKKIKDRADYQIQLTHLKSKEKTYRQKEKERVNSCQILNELKDGLNKLLEENGMMERFVSSYFDDIEGHKIDLITIRKDHNYNQNMDIAFYNGRWYFVFLSHFTAIVIGQSNITDTIYKLFEYIKMIVDDKVINAVVFNKRGKEKNNLVYTLEEKAGQSIKFKKLMARRKIEYYTWSGNIAEEMRY